MSKDELFEWFWVSFPKGYGNKGAKKNAKKEFNKIKPDRDMVEQMIQAAHMQAAEKEAKRSRNMFAEPFKHVERWLKNEEWENDIDMPSNPIEVKGRQSTFESLTDSSWADGLTLTAEGRVE